MYALMVKDDYIDLLVGYKYEIYKVCGDYHIKLKGSPRRYLMGSFIIYDDNGKVLSQKEARRRWVFKNTLAKFGMSVLFGLISLLSITPVYAEETTISDEAIISCYAYGEEYDICPELLIAIIEHESGGDPNAKNGRCLGLMQVSERWHYDRMEKLDCNDLYDEDQNIHVGADYLAELFEKYEDPYLVLMAYNMGDKKALELYKKGKYTKYAVSICERSADLERIHEKRRRYNGKRVCIKNLL